MSPKERKCVRCGEVATCSNGNLDFCYPCGLNVFTHWVDKELKAVYVPQEDRGKIKYKNGTMIAPETREEMPPVARTMPKEIKKEKKESP